ncbi:nucleotidyltransferase domain-containing protein [Patescibacteria group bacterium]|nr:nucleotidyltransferase domain-containing protein [Patescibacteria group bacterium]
MLKTLFSSNTRIKLLTLFFTNQGKDFYLREIEKLIKENITSIRRELISLKKIGLFSEYLRGNNKYYKLNKDFPLYSELKNIIFKTTGIKGILERTLKKIKNIKLSFIYGSYAKGVEKEKSDIDLMIIGSPNYTQTLKSLKNIEKKLNREIDFIIYSEEEFAEKMKNNYFVRTVIESPKINLINNVDEYIKKITKRK